MAGLAGRLAASERRRRGRADLARTALAGAAGVAGATLAAQVLAAAPSPALTGLVTGVATFIVRSCRRAPGDVALLADVDRTLDLRELLSTAATLPADDDSPAARAVRAMADARADAIDVAAIERPARGPTLTTAGLSLAAAIALAVTLASPPATPGDGGAGSIAAATPAASVDRVDASPAPGEDGTRRRPGDATSPGDRPRGDATADRAVPRAGDDAAGRSSGASAAVVPPTPTRSPSHTAGDARADAGGVGSSDAPRNVAADVTATAARARLDVAPSPIGSTSSADAARAAIDDGRVPARSRDLVRAYFGLDDEGRDAR